MGAVDWSTFVVPVVIKLRVIWPGRSETTDICVNLNNLDSTWNTLSSSHHTHSLPWLDELAGSAQQEALTQVQLPAGALTALGPAESQPGPGHHLRLPKRATEDKFVPVGNDLRHAAAEIRYQIFSVNRPLVGADELQDLCFHHQDTTELLTHSELQQQTTQTIVCDETETRLCSTGVNVVLSMCSAWGRPR